MNEKKIAERQMYKYLLLLTIASVAGLQGWRTLFNNFAVDVVGVNGFWIGLIQSTREVPGFLALLVIFVLVLIKEHHLSAISVVVLGVGVMMTGFFPSNLGLLMTTFLMSVGFHYFETTNQSLTLQYFNQHESAIVFGRLKSYSAITNILIGLIIWFIAGFFSYRIMFLFIGIIVLTIGIIALFKDPSDKSLPPQHKKMILRKKYWLFYILNFFSGARRQIFMVFAVFLLVERYHYSIQTITILFIINNVINFFTAPLIAKSINKFGERKVLSLEYGSLVLIFMAYAFLKSPLIAGGLYVLDHMFFSFSIGIKTYFQKTADKADIAPSMAVSFTINHISAIFLPFVGGLLWIYSWRLPFLVGSGLSLISLIFVQKIRTK
jgi:MFS family permease